MRYSRLNYTVSLIRSQYLDFLLLFEYYPHMRMLRKLARVLLPQKVAYAHCDVPCGIYDPKSAQIAAATILKMTQKLQESQVPEGEHVENIMYTRHHNDVVRFIITKEEHARILKHELMTLWADYFKQEHLEKFPDLHEKFWKTMKLTSKAKQTVDDQIAQDLVKAVDEIADIFNQTKTSK